MYPDYAVLVLKLVLNSEIWKVYLRHGLPFLRHGDFLGLTSRDSCDRDRHLATWRPGFRTLKFILSMKVSVLIFSIS